MKRSLLSLPLALAALFAGCSNPADSVSAAKVSSDAPATNAPAADTSTLKRFVFGPESSKIQFVGSKVTGSHDGGFNKFDGELFVGADGKLAGSGNKVNIDTTSLWSDNDRLTGHLKNADFFDVEKFPTSTFVSTDVSQQGTNSTVTGNLTLHGITKQVSFPASIQVSEQAVTVVADFSIDRFDFEMKYPGRADDLIRKEVVIKLNLKAAPAPQSVAAR
jgi:polyisoprenoid-binding protein YceI